jgi:hypothetical protein
MAPDVDGRIVMKWKEGRDVQRFLVGNPEGKRKLVRLRLRWEDKIKELNGRDKHRILVG